MSGLPWRKIFLAILVLTGTVLVGFALAEDWAAALIAALGAVVIAVPLYAWLEEGLRAEYLSRAESAVHASDERRTAKLREMYHEVRQEVACLAVEVERRDRELLALRSEAAELRAKLLEQRRQTRDRRGRFLPRGKPEHTLVEGQIVEVYNERRN